MPLNQGHIYPTLSGSYKAYNWEVNPALNT